jgi:RIO-like serine/threonine protein kinase
MQISIYSIQDTPIGRGRMGQIYLGTDPQGRRIVIKEIRMQDTFLRKCFINQFSSFG